MLTLRRHRAVVVVIAALVGGAALLPSAPAARSDVLPAEGHLPPPPKPEPVKVEELPLPPTAPSTAAGACSASVNPRRTGCIESDPEAMQSGGYLPDGKAVSAAIVFAGAPTAPDPASIYSGREIVIVKADGTKFPNG